MQSGSGEWKEVRVCKDCFAAVARELSDKLRKDLYDRGVALGRERGEFNDCAIRIEIVARCARGGATAWLPIAAL